jgi:hypothetical protein
VRLVVAARPASFSLFFLAYPCPCPDDDSNLGLGEEGRGWAAQRPWERRTRGRGAEAVWGSGGLTPAVTAVSRIEVRGSIY